MGALLVVACHTRVPRPLFQFSLSRTVAHTPAFLFAEAVRRATSLSGGGEEGGKE